MSDYQIECAQALDQLRALAADVLQERGIVAALDNEVELARRNLQLTTDELNQAVQRRKAALRVMDKHATFCRSNLRISAEEIADAINGVLSPESV